LVRRRTCGARWRLENRRSIKCVIEGILVRVRFIYLRKAISHSASFELTCESSSARALERPKSDRAGGVKRELALERPKSDRAGGAKCEPALERPKSNRAGGAKREQPKSEVEVYTKFKVFFFKKKREVDEDGKRKEPKDGGEKGKLRRLHRFLPQMFFVVGLRDCGCGGGGQASTEATPWLTSFQPYQTLPREPFIYHDKQGSTFYIP
jgi:hypothetical protein